MRELRKAECAVELVCGVRWSDEKSVAAACGGVIRPVKADRRMACFSGEEYAGSVVPWECSPVEDVVNCTLGDLRVFDFLGNLLDGFSDIFETQR